MYDVELLPPKLSIDGGLGLKCKGCGSKADLQTIWDTPYPVLTNYRNVCLRADIVPYGDGTIWRQGANPRIPGFITSGYRDSGGLDNSAHKFALAIDFIVGEIERQIEVAKIALDSFTRIGLYPDTEDGGILHLDLANRVWMRRYGAKRYWVKHNGVYTGFDFLILAVDFAKEID